MGTVDIAPVEMVRKPRKRGQASHLPKTSHLGAHFSKSRKEERCGLSRGQPHPHHQLSLWPLRPLQPGHLHSWVGLGARDSRYSFHN